ncbi:MAG: NAD(+)/NADH kinase [Bacilli bacterium]
MRKINRVKLFSNKTEKSEKIAYELTKILKEYGFEIAEDYDLAIAIGGDGAFLRMVKDNNFDSSIYYVGVNTGTLGFLQEIKPEEIRKFVESLNNDEFKVDYIGVLEVKITTDNKVSKYYTLNELVVRELELNAFYADLYIDKVKLEKFVGDGLLIATSVGSSAYNTSFRGALVYNTLHTIQINPIAPINTRAYRNLINPIILPEHKHIEIYPTKPTVLAVFDGENKRYNNVLKIECCVKNKKLKFLRTKDYNYINIINEKFLTD